MIKTMKVKNQLRLDELIKYVFDNELEDLIFESDKGGKVSFDTFGRFEALDHVIISPNSTFTIEFEEEISDKVIFPKTLTLNDNGTLREHCNRSVESLKMGYENAVQIHAVINGKLELIWEGEGNASI